MLNDLAVGLFRLSNRLFPFEIMQAHRAASLELKRFIINRISEKA